MSATTTTFNAEASLTKSQAAYKKLKQRAGVVALAIQAAQPVNERTPSQQEAFMLTFADLKKLELLLPLVESVVQSLPLAKISSKAKGHKDGFLGALLELGAEVTAAATEEIGVSPTVFFESMIKDLERHLELLESIVSRAEGTLKDVGA